MRDVLNRMDIGDASGRRATRSDRSAPRSEHFQKHMCRSSALGSTPLCRIRHRSSRTHLGAEMFTWTMQLQHVYDRHRAGRVQAAEDSEDKAEDRGDPRTPTTYTSTPTHAHPSPRAPHSPRTAEAPPKPRAPTRTTAHPTSTPPDATLRDTQKSTQTLNFLETTPRTHLHVRHRICHGTLIRDTERTVLFKCRFFIHMHVVNERHARWNFSRDRTLKKGTHFGYKLHLLQRFHEILHVLRTHDGTPFERRHVLQHGTLMRDRKRREIMLFER